MGLRVAIAGGTGTVGRLVTEHARRRGHEPIVLSRSTGIDLMTGEGLDAVLAGVDAVIDVSGSQTLTAAASVRFFQTTTGMLLEAEQRAGVGHHLALSIVGTDRVPDSAYLRAKLTQENLIRKSGVPYSILRSTQFFEFIGRIAQSGDGGNSVRVSAALFQPILDRAEQALRQLLASVHGDLPGAMLQRRIFEPRNELVAIAGQIDPGHRQRGDHLDRHQVMHEPAEGGVLHHIRDIGVPGQIAEIG